MRSLLLALSLAFLLAEPLGVAAQAEDAEPDEEVEEAVQAATEEAGVPAPPQPAGPQPQAKEASAEAAPVGAVSPAVKTTSSLKRFGKSQKKTEVPNAIHLASSFKRFGAKVDKAAAEGEQEQEADGDDAEKQASVEATNAHSAAKAAKHAAKIANKVAESSVHITEHARSALKNARDALHQARVDAAGLSAKQKEDLKTAEAKLKEATKKADYGAVKNAKYVKAKTDSKKVEKLQKLEEKMAKVQKEKKKEKAVELNKQSGNMKQDKQKDEELEAMRKDIQDLRNELKKKEGEKAEDDAVLKELQDNIKQMEKDEEKEDKTDQKGHDELKAEIERLRAQVQDMKDAKKEPQPAPQPAAQPAAAPEEEVEKYNVKLQPLSKADPGDEVEDVVDKSQASPVEQRGIDIDTAMPYGDLEPFGREDTAQELTEDSINQSDAMVDQLERAEVSEEKRAVFRALTRLRGAAITSFDGVARSQTGNIDEYNKVHKWRETHPLHHLADEESDVSKWAFPDNAD